MLGYEYEDLFFDLYTKYALRFQEYRIEVPNPIVNRREKIQFINQNVHHNANEFSDLWKKHIDKGIPIETSITYTVDGESERNFACIMKFNNISKTARKPIEPYYEPIVTLDENKLMKDVLDPVYEEIFGDDCFIYQSFEIITQFEEALFNEALFKDINYIRNQWIAEVQYYFETNKIDFSQQDRETLEERKTRVYSEASMTSNPKTENTTNALRSDVRNRRNDVVRRLAHYDFEELHDHSIVPVVQMIYGIDQANEENVKKNEEIKKIYLEALQKYQNTIHSIEQKLVQVLSMYRR